MALDAPMMSQQIFKIFKKYSPNMELTIEQFYELEQPKEPLKRALEDLCEFNKTTKGYRLKRTFQN